MTLKEFFNENPSVALGFSGGVDSSYLLYAALRHGAQVKAYYVKTSFQPAFELRDAHRLAKELGAELQVVTADVLTKREIASNPPDRCYHCKALIFGAICRQALSDGIGLVIDGTNASDDARDRPGMTALAELSVRSPLRECGIRKDEIRALSREAGLFTWNKPAYACLATRIPWGSAITEGLLRRVEGAEEALSTLGFSDFRVRVAGEAGRLQVPESDMSAVLARKTDIIAALKPYFCAVYLDLEGR